MRNYEAEEAVLGGILTCEEEFLAVFDRLEPEDFELAFYEQFYGACRDYYREHGKLVDLEVTQTLGTEEKQLLHYCRQSFVSRSLFDDYVDIVHKNGQRRRLTNRIQEALNWQPEDLAEQLNTILIEQQQNAQAHRYSDLILDQMLQFTKELYNPAEQESRIKTGLWRIDALLGGLRLQTVSYVGARPSTGKTAFALNVLKRQFETENKTVFFSLEMSANQIFERMLSDLLKLSYRAINDRNLRDEQRAAMRDKMASLYETGKLYVIDNRYTIESIGQTIAELKPQLVIVDFIQCVSTAGRFQTRRNEIDYISQQFKRLAKRYNCHIMVLSQMTRDPTRGNKSPKMSDLKESGGLEQDGDYIMILHRPYVLDKENFKPYEAELNIDKNKYGQCGSMALNFDGDQQRFTEPQTGYGRNK